MKNVYLVVLFTFLACSLHAQVKSSHAEKVEVSAGIGYGWLLNSNLSPYGLHYRGNYDGGIQGSVDAFYKFSKRFGIGALCTSFSTSGNYSVGPALVSEDIQVNYVGPQMKFSCDISDRCILSVSYGGGYLWYTNKGWQDETEYKVTAHSWGVNINCGVAYRVLSHLDVFANIGCFGTTDIKKSKVESQGATTEEEMHDPYKLSFKSIGLMAGILSSSVANKHSLCCLSIFFRQHRVVRLKKLSCIP